MWKIHFHANSFPKASGWNETPPHGIQTFGLFVAVIFFQKNMQWRYIYIHIHKCTHGINAYTWPKQIKTAQRARYWQVISLHACLSILQSVLRRNYCFWVLCVLLKTVTHRQEFLQICDTSFPLFCTDLPSAFFFFFFLLNTVAWRLLHDKYAQIGLRFLMSLWHAIIQCAVFTYNTLVYSTSLHLG